MTDQVREENENFPPIVMKALWNLRRDHISFFGTTGGMMMSNNEVREWCDDIAQVDALLRGMGQDVPEITDSTVLHIMKRAEMPPSDRTRALLWPSSPLEPIEVLDDV